MAGKMIIFFALFLLTAFTTAATAFAEDDEAELAKKLNNPVSDLISVPIQNNWDFGYGPDNAMRYTVNIQPVVPLSITTDWNLIIRTILPIIYAQSPVQGGLDHHGLGDITQSFFFSPNAGVGGWLMGAGPVLLYPTATDGALGGQKYGAGPTIVVLQQRSGWTYGILANQIWSITGNSERDNISATFLQPFVAYTTKTYTTLTLNTESTYNWKADENRWRVPINLMVSQLVKFGEQTVAFQLGYRYYADNPYSRPDTGPDAGIRFAVTFLLPK
jgi:hypothetical protein